jgi:hypothetical protein
LNGHREAVAVLLRADNSTAEVTEEAVCANLFKFKPDDMGKCLESPLLAHILKVKQVNKTKIRICSILDWILANNAI